MAEIYFIDINKITPLGWDKIKKSLPMQRLQKVEELAKENDKKLSLAAGYLLTVALAGCGVEEQTLEFGEFGKPYLKCGGVCFNLSHSGNFAVCAVAKSEVGVDVQSINKCRSILSKVLSQSEREYVCTDMAKFCRVWAIKESVMKYYGKGLALGSAAVQTQICEDGVLIKLGEKSVNLQIKEYSLNTACVAVCSCGENFPACMKEVVV